MAPVRSSIDALAILVRFCQNGMTQHAQNLLRDLRDRNGTGHYITKLLFWLVTEAGGSVPECHSLRGVILNA